MCICAYGSRICGRREAETGGENAVVMGEDGVLTDIATGSMTVAALRYGIVELDENRDFTYTMASVNTMREEAEERFKNRTHKQVAEALENISAAPEEKGENGGVCRGYQL